MVEKIFLAWLHYIWISQKKLSEIFKTKQNYKEIFDNITSSFLLKYWFSESQINFILEKHSKIKLKKIEEILNERKVKIITIFDEEYPKLLKQIPNPPFLFYLRWEIDNSPKISVVWTRKISSYWKNVIEKIIPDLSNFFTIVSGWAAWCDTFAHISTLNSKNKTISVIWTWIDYDYPVTNKKLYDEIVEKGWWVISIFPISEVWNPYNFPIRNEIIAWLSVWTLIIEWKEKSWTLITASLALELWKDLFAIPWDIFKGNSDWCNNLIKLWNAKLVTWINDILEEYNISSIKKELKKIELKDKLEKDIYNLILIENLTVDEIVRELWVELSIIINKLSLLELKKIIRKWLWWKYEIN